MVNFSYIASAIVLSLIAAPTLAQSVEVVDTLDVYKIMRVVQSKVCFAVYNGKSADGSDVTYATYKTKEGDRWQVVGYVDDEKTTTTKGDLLTIQFDGKPVLARAVQFSRGDFALPFTEDKDLQDFDAGVANANKLSFQLKNLNDTITLDLVALRIAKTSVDSCLEAIQ
ncbi:MAG: hypothetical protein N2B02_09200 [Amylibacter sp.]